MPWEGLNGTTNEGDQLGQGPLIVEKGAVGRGGMKRGAALDVGNDNIKERTMLRLSTSQVLPRGRAKGAFTTSNEQSAKSAQDCRRRLDR